MAGFFDDPIGSLLNAYVEVEKAKVGERLSATAPNQRAAETTVPLSQNAQAKNASYTTDNSMSTTTKVVIGVVVVVVLGGVAWAVAKR